SDERRKFDAKTVATQNKWMHSTSEITLRSIAAPSSFAAGFGGSMVGGKNGDRASRHSSSVPCCGSGHALLPRSFTRQTAYRRAEATGKRKKKDRPPGEARSFDSVIMRPGLTGEQPGPLDPSACGARLIVTSREPEPGRGPASRGPAHSRHRSNHRRRSSR